MQDSMAVAYFRGIAASQLVIAPDMKGAMIAIGMSSEAVQGYLGRLTSGKAVVACINSPSSVTVSGDVTAVDELSENLKDKSVFFRRLAVDVAYHSHHMEIVAHEYLASIEHISPRHSRDPVSHPGKVSIFSSVTGTEINTSEMGAQYWVSNLLGQVKFSDALKNLCFETDSHQTMTGLISLRRVKRHGAAQKPSVDCLIEIGPHSALSGPIKQIIQDDPKLRTANITYLSILSRKNHAVSSALHAASTLARMSYPLDFEAINFQRDVEFTRKPRLLVNMPSYRWNHTKSYWAEPRMSKAYRNRESPRTDLLGAPDIMACPFERRWRNYLRAAEIPWLQDHRIQSDMIFPAAGYIAMAIEAIMQLVKDSDPMEEFLLKNVRIRSALIVPEATGVEVMTSLRDFDKDLTDETDRWYEFHIYSVSSDDRWTEHCVGVVGTQTGPSLTDDETFVNLNGLATAPAASENSHISVIDIPQLYKKLHDSGLEYGTCFSNLTCAHATQQGICFAEVTIPDTRDLMPVNFEHRSLIHPCTLDSIFHAIFAALPEDMDLDTGPLIPVSFEAMKVSSRIQRSAGEILSVCTHVRRALKNNVVTSITAADNLGSGASVKPKLSINGLRCARLEGSATHVENKSDIPIAYGIEWNADPGFVSKENAAFLFQQQDINGSECSAVREDRERYTANLIQDAIVTLSAEVEGKSDSSSIGYRDDLTAILQIHSKDSQGHLQNGHMPLREGGMGVTGDIGVLLRTVSHLLSAFPLEDLEAFKDAQSKLWDSYRTITVNNSAYRAAVNYVALIGNKKPDIAVLEISDGGERPYSLFLDGLIPRTGVYEHRIPHCSKYTFAYREDYGLERARADYADWKDMVNFEKLDLNGDLSQQELSKHAYDVIVAPNAFYSTHLFRDGILKIKSLLKPGGYLIILNILLPERSILDALLVTIVYHWPHSAVGFLRYGDRGKGEILREAGFKAENIINEGLIICRPDYGTDSFDKKILVIRGDHDEVSRKLSEALQQQLPGESTVSNTIEALSKGRICIVLSDLERSSFQNPDAELLQKLKEIFLRSEGVLWVTRGGTLHATNPQAGLAVGFARTARSESGVQPIITLDLDPKFSILDDSRVKIIVDLIKTHFYQDGLSEYDTEYAERDKIVLVPRVVAQDELSRDITKMDKEDTTIEQLFQKVDRPVSLLQNEMGKKDVHFTAAKQIMELPEGYVGVRVCAFAISELDTDGSYDPKTLLGAIGFGCSGQVYELGPNVNEFSVGDRVACLGTGTARNYYHDQACAFQKIEHNISYELAASLPLAYTAAYYIIHDIARIDRGDMVLIHNAASWYGQALVEICLLIKCDVIAIVFNESQKDELSKRFKMASRQVFVDVEGMEMVRHLLEFTHGRLPRTVITSAESNSKTFRLLCKLTAPFGHIIHLRARSPDSQAANILSSDIKNISFSTFDASDIQPERLPSIYEAWSTVMSLFHQGKLQGSSCYSVHKVTDVTKAIDTVSSTNFAVITAEANDVVQVRVQLDCIVSVLCLTDSGKISTSNVSKNIFHKEASYLLVGGLGGIGRAIAFWMVEHGAKYLILVNRGGLSTETARSTVQLLRDKGVEVAVHGCDISDEQAFSEMYTELSRAMPPIKGVIQGAMILKVCWQNQLDILEDL
jgi:acyl transferase domain-containing protein/NADPH:quinone reductase-like Zn-dependent oxidoreductase